MTLMALLKQTAHAGQPLQFKPPLPHLQTPGMQAQHTLAAAPHLERLSQAALRILLVCPRGIDAQPHGAGAAQNAPVLALLRCHGLVHLPLHARLLSLHLQGTQRMAWQRHANRASLSPATTSNECPLPHARLLCFELRAKCIAHSPAGRALRCQAALCLPKAAL